MRSNIAGWPGHAWDRLSPAAFTKKGALIALPLDRSFLHPRAQSPTPATRADPSVSNSSARSPTRLTQP